MPKTRVNGVEISHEVSGRGTPALFIHGGFGGTGSTLVQQPRQISTLFPEDKVQIITYDRRCAGQSQYLLDWYTLPDLAADARALLGHLGIDRSIVIGDSMGGMVAQQYALTYAEHTSALCLMETGADLMSDTFFGKQGQTAVDRHKSEGDRAVFEAERERLRNPPAAPAFGARTPEIAARFQAQREAMLAALAKLPDEDLFLYSSGMVRNYAAFLGYDFGPRLRELKMPVCVIHGSADTTVPFEYGKALHAAIPQSEFHEIANATHGVLMFPGTPEALSDWVQRMAAVPAGSG